jgi:hypothetical protein
VSKKTVIPLHGLVICDSCNKDYTGLPDSGGFVFGSYGYCPECAPRLMNDIKRYKEEQYIKATCPEDVSFHQFILNYRRNAGQSDNITIWEV